MIKDRIVNSSLDLTQIATILMLNLVEEGVWILILLRLPAIADGHHFSSLIVALKLSFEVIGVARFANRGLSQDLWFMYLMLLQKTMIRFLRSLVSSNNKHKNDRLEKGITLVCHVLNSFTADCNTPG